ENNADSSRIQDSPGTPRNPRRMARTPIRRLRQIGAALGQRKIPGARTHQPLAAVAGRDRKSTRLNSSHVKNSYAAFCLKKKKEGVRIGNGIVDNTMREKGRVDMKEDNKRVCEKFSNVRLRDDGGWFTQTHWGST